MPSTTIWIHGNVVKVEAIEPQSVEIIRRGWGTHFLLRDSQATYWFHFPLPTFSTAAEAEVILSKVYVLFATDKTELLAVHVYNGPIRINTFEDLYIRGDHSREVDSNNSWSVNPPVEVSRGLGISVGVRVLQGEQYGLPGILFTTAGAQLINPEE